MASISLSEQQVELLRMMKRNDDTLFVNYLFVGTLRKTAGVTMRHGVRDMIKAGLLKNVLIKNVPRRATAYVLSAQGLDYVRALEASMEEAIEEVFSVTPTEEVVEEVVEEEPPVAPQPIAGRPVIEEKEATEVEVLKADISAAHLIMDSVLKSSVGSLPFRVECLVKTVRAALSERESHKAHSLKGMSLIDMVNSLAAKNEEGHSSVAVYGSTTHPEYFVIVTTNREIVDSYINPDLGGPDVLPLLVKQFRAIEGRGCCSGLAYDGDKEVLYHVFLNKALDAAPILKSMTMPRERWNKILNGKMEAHDYYGRFLSGKMESCLRFFTVDWEKKELAFMEEVLEPTLKSVIVETPPEALTEAANEVELPVTASEDLSEQEEQ